MKLNCKEASRVISAGLDKELSLAERTALRLHLIVCDACNKFKAQLIFLRRALAMYPGPEDENGDSKNS
jgi:hypothetical protein